MKGLLLKDLYVLTRQMRMFLVIILIFSVLPGNNMTIFAVVYSAMMPYTALAYDERSKWDQMAGMMPYSTRDIVLSKYVLGWLFSAAAVLVSLIANSIESHFISTPGSPLFVVMSFFIGLIMMAITLPPMFYFGVERGRMFFILLIVILACGSAGLISGLANTPAAAALLALLKPLLPAAAVVLTLISVPLSIRLYQKRS